MYGFYDFSTEITDADKEGFQKTADFMYESGMIENELDVNTLFIQNFDTQKLFALTFFGGAKEIQRILCLDLFFISNCVLSYYIIISIIY